MITDEQLDDLPDEPDEAICYLVEALRKSVREYESHERRDWEIEREYVNLVRGFLIEFEIDIGGLSNDEPPVDDGDFGAYYRYLNVVVDQYVASARIRMAMRRKRDLIPLTAGTKARIQKHIQNIRDILHRLDIPIDKKEQILDKLNQLSSAVDKERTNVRRILDVALEVADTGDEISKKFDGIRKHVDSITGLLAEARKFKEKVLGIGSRKPKQLEAPKKQLPAPDSNLDNDLDDDIPF